MANYDSSLTGAQIEAALEAVNGLIVASNNGKILTVENGALAAKTAIEIQGGTIDALSVTANGTYTHAANGGYSPVTVNVLPSLDTLSATENGTYTPSSGFVGYSQVTVNVSGGSPTRPYAFVYVTFPSDATSCTISNGTETITATTTSPYMFYVTASGTWTVTISKTGATASKSVSVTASGTCSSVVMTFEKYIYKSGEGAQETLYTYAQSAASVTDDNTKITVAMSAYASVQTCIRTSSSIDITNYSKLYFDIECTALGGETAYQGRFIVSSTTFKVDTFDQEIAERIVVNSTRHIKEIDISSLTGDMYIGTSGAWAGNIYNIYLA